MSHLSQNIWFSTPLTCTPTTPTCQSSVVYSKAYDRELRTGFHNDGEKYKSKREKNRKKGKNRKLRGRRFP